MSYITFLASSNFCISTNDCILEGYYVSECFCQQESTCDGTTVTTPNDCLAVHKEAVTTRGTTVSKHAFVCS